MNKEDFIKIDNIVIRKDQISAIYKWKNSNDNWMYNIHIIGIAKSFQIKEEYIPKELMDLFELNEKVNFSDFENDGEMISGDDIDREYGIPLKEISCPSCGQKYGHHGTIVDLNSNECSSCVKEFGYKDTDFVDGEYFIEEILGYQKMC